MEETNGIVRKDTDYIQQLEYMTHAAFFPRFIGYLIDIIVLWGCGSADNRAGSDYARC